jgi:hypothetical protein
MHPKAVSLKRNLALVTFITVANTGRVQLA